MSKPRNKPKSRKAAKPKPTNYNEVLAGVVELLDAARRASARVVNSLMTATYWEIGRRIVEHEQGGQKRAGYGEELLEGLSRDLTQRFGRGFGVIQLRTMRQFYTAHPLPDKIQSVIGESPIRQSVIDESTKNLTVAPIRQSAIGEFSNSRSSPDNLCAGSRPSLGCPMHAERECQCDDNEPFGQAKEHWR